MGSIGAPEVLIIAGVLILLFGAKKLPEMARSLGKAKGEFKKGLDEEEAAKASVKPKPAAAPTSAAEPKSADPTNS